MPRSSTPREFRAFYRDHYGFVWAAVRRFGVPPAWVDDATQDAFVVAYRRHAELRGSPRPWLYGIAFRVVSDYRRRVERYGALSLDPDRYPLFAVRSARPVVERQSHLRGQLGVRRLELGEADGALAAGRGLDDHRNQ